jgi:acyl phosphate:glycerol-3-phosphate acyltransferase
MSVGALVVVAASFLAGAIPFGLLLGRWRGVDVRRTGSGNIGATNVMRVAGRRLGLLTFLLDGLKGAIGPMTIRLIGWGAGWQEASVLAAVAGHCFSPFLRGRGGKGVATFIGGTAVVSPMAGALGGGMFAISLLAFRYVGLSSALMALASTATLAMLPEGGRLVAFTSLTATALIAVRHGENWRRMASGREPRAFEGRRTRDRDHA